MTDGRHRPALSPQHRHHPPVPHPAAAAHYRRDLTSITCGPCTWLIRLDILRFEYTQYISQPLPVVGSPPRWAIQPPTTISASSRAFSSRDLRRGPPTSPGHGRRAGMDPLCPERVGRSCWSIACQRSCCCSFCELGHWREAVRAPPYHGAV